jgi:flagellar hook-associated protein 1 FlgK
VSGIFTALNVSSQSLAAYQKAINISQNNVNNAYTAGYAAQIVDFSALSFDARSGLAGGVTSSGVSTRSVYLDESVRTQLANLGSSQQRAESLTGIQSSFDVTGATGVPGALTSLFSSFSALSVAPANITSRQAVLSAAQNVAAAFQQTSAELANSASGADRQVQSQVNQINALSAEIAGYNSERGQTGTEDAGRDAKLSAALEKISSLVNISTRAGANGGTDVLVDGQIPLVLESQNFFISSQPAPAPTAPPLNPSGPAALQIVDGEGRDISSHFSGGTVAGLLQFRNGTLGSLRGDTSQSGSLNELAKGFADRVNNLLTSGVISQGPPAQTGLPLFSYSATDPTATASTLSVISGFTASQIATIDPGPPTVSNGISLQLANAVHGTNAADQVKGLSYAKFFGEIAGGVGRELAAQTSAADVHQQAVTQAQSFRAQLSGVSLDAEAVKLVQYQKAYGASAKLITVLDQITQSTLDILK